MELKHFFLTRAIENPGNVPRKSPYLALFSALLYTRINSGAFSNTDAEATPDSVQISRGGSPSISLFGSSPDDF